jgi:hypothetical protein
MSVTRVRLVTFAAVSIAVGLTASTSHAQSQSEPPTVRDYCIKVAPGKGAEFDAYLRDVAVPLAQSRADSGEFTWFIAIRSVVPAGSSARCDYRVAYGYKGLPPEELSKEGLDAALKRAKLTLTADQLIARRTSLTSLVGAEIWYQIDGIGPDVEKGGYLRLNHYKVQSGETDEWVRLEKTYWKALMDAWLKAGGKGGWGVYGLWMPGGDSTPYNGVTVDTFPDWNALMRGVPATELWPKVHPNTTPTETFARLDKVRSIHDVEYYKVAEVVRGK